MKRPAKLSPQMLRMLDDVDRGLGTHGTANTVGDHGGRYGTIYALRTRGLLNDDNQLTDGGRAVLAIVRGAPK